MKPLSEVVLTNYRYQLGGWLSFLSSLAQYVAVGERIRVRLRDFSLMEERDAIDSLRRLVGIKNEIATQAVFFGSNRWFEEVDEYIDHPHSRDSIIVLRALPSTER